MDNKLKNENIKKLLMSLAFPAIIAQLMTLFYSIVDRIYIGQLNDSSNIIAGIGICNVFVLIIMAFTNLFGKGGAPLVSIALGKDNHEEARKIYTNCFSLLVIVSIILMIFIWLFNRPILSLFVASNKVLDYATTYLNIYNIGTLFNIVSLGMNYFINAQGYAKESMITLVIGALANIILDPLFIYYFMLGVPGVAIASVIGQGLSFIWVLIFMFRHNHSIRVDFKYLKPSFISIKEIIKVGLAPFFMNASEGLLQGCFNRQLMLYGGDLAVCAMTVMSSIGQILFLPIDGISQGGQPIISYNYGDRNKQRVKDTIKLMVITSLSISIIGVLIIEIFPGLFIRIFSNDSQVMEYTLPLLRIYILGYLLMGVNGALQQSYISMKDGIKSFYFVFLRKIVLLIPLIMILPKVNNLGVFGIIMAEPISDLITASSNALYFRIYLKKNLFFLSK